MNDERTFTNDASERELNSLAIAPYNDYYIYNSHIPCEITDDSAECIGRSSPYAHTIEPIYWYTITPIEFQGSSSSTDKEQIFVTPPGHDFLCNTHLKIEIPQVKIKPLHIGEYKVCWTPDLAYHITLSGKMKIGGMALCSIDRYWMIFDHQYNSNADHKVSLDRDCGNIPQLTEWNEFLPRRTLKPPQHWYYARGDGRAFPLYRLNSQNPLTHVYSLNTDVIKLLRMLKKTPTGWINVPVDLNILSITNKKGEPLRTLVNIRMYGELSEVTPAEKESVYEKINTFTIEDIVGNGEVKKQGYDEVANVELITTNGLTRASYWAAQNFKASSLNYYSNFSTNCNDSKLGNNPLRKISLKFDGYEKIKKLDADDFSGALARNHFKSTPTIVGLHAHAYASKMNEINNVAINAKDLKPVLGCYFVKSKYVEKEDEKDTFILIARSQVTKHIKFDDGRASFVTPLPQAGLK